MSWHLALLVGLAVADPALGAPLSARQLVNKVSQVTTNRPAAAQDVAAFEAAVATGPEGFPGAYRHLLANFLARPEYPETIERIHALWWHLPFGSVAKHAGFVVSQNRSYDELFVRDYIYTDVSLAGVYRQLGVKVLDSLPDEAGAPKLVRLSPEETRFRGLFGSLEFLQVYPDATTNLNRKRANQVFRVAFCQSLANTVSLPTLHASLADDHGTNPDCVGCHRRLDPMARFFDHWRPPTIDGSFAEWDPAAASAGTVLLGGPLGTDRSYPGNGDGDLGAIVIRQPEFPLCMADLAWQYVFGKEVALDEQTRQAMSARFSASRRFNDLVADALNHPYFWSDAEAPALVYTDVKPRLRDCRGCHANSGGTRFDSNVYPFRADLAENLALLKRMWGALSHYAGFRPMPEAPRPNLSQEDMDALRAWIESGARDEQGMPTVTDEEAEEILQ